MWSQCSGGLVLGVTVVITVAVQLSHARSNWNQDTREYLLNIHNDLRRNEGGCQVNKLEYDDELENQARQWAEACVYKHSTEERGENLAWNPNPLTEKELINHAAEQWFGEKKTYSYGQYDCGTSLSCHYTQIVWGKTNRLGCYSTYCDSLAGAGRNAWYIVCLYQPRGNWKGEKPYEKSCPTPCLKGQTEEDGLCVGTPDKTEEELRCDDEDEHCALWASNGSCKDNKTYMEKHCKKSCKVCVSDEAEACEDIEKDCATWASTGQCKGNPTYMNYNCKKSCGKC